MPSYKLTYFNGRGFAELSRLLFTMAGVEYEDIRMKDREEFLTKYKPFLPTGQVPVLTVDGKEFPQSAAIARYLAREFKLYGKDNLESLQCDVVMDTITDIRTAMRPVFLENDETKKEELKQKALKEGVPPVLAMLEKFAGDGTGAGNGVFVGESITIADIAFFRMMETVQVYFADILNDYPKLKAIDGKVAAEPKIAAWLAKRPDTPW